MIFTIMDLGLQVKTSGLSILQKHVMLMISTVLYMDILCNNEGRSIDNYQ